MENTRKQTTSASAPLRSERWIVWWILGVVVVALALLARASFAQTPPVKKIAVHGTVVNSTSGQPVAGAMVSLSDSRWGTVTNNKGRFNLPRVEPGNVTLTVNQLGYQNIEWKGVVSSQQDTVQIPLPPKPKLLKGLNVVNARLEQRRQGTAASVIAFNERQLATTRWSNVTDFLNARAGLLSEPCPYWMLSQQCYQVDGQIVSPIVFINEVPIPGGMEDLKTMWPQDLYLVEVYARGAEIRVYTKPFMKRAARTDFHPMAIGF